MIIGIDIDDTITNSYEVIIKEISKHYNKEYQELIDRNITYYDLFTSEEFPNYEDFVTNNFTRIIPDVELKENVREIIKQLHDDGHKIVFITARHDWEYQDAYDFTYKFLKDNDIYFDKLITNIDDKGKTAKEENIELFIDDSIINCQKVIENNIDTLLFDNIFNKNNNEIKRINSWNDVYNYVNNKYDLI
ncbi:MAG: hypothetical protein PHQ64_02360 [Bacilli bacterium]|nr:hypothetical protein [Bacilli bacterium]